MKWVAALRHHHGLDCPVFLNFVEGGHFLAPDEELQMSSIEAYWLQRHCLSAKND